MKNIILTSALVLASAVAGEAMAFCDGTGGFTLATNTSTKFSGKTICATAVVSGETWHEYHDTTNLEKIGNGTAADSNVVVGIWDPPSSSTVRYSYTGDAGSPYTYTVYENGNNVELCGTINATGTLTAGKILTACP